MFVMLADPPGVKAILPEPGVPPTAIYWLMRTGSRPSARPSAGWDRTCRVESLDVTMSCYISCYISRSIGVIGGLPRFIVDGGQERHK
jgi:hypothetical protein